jgi:hypothetical protein
VRKEEKERRREIGGGVQAQSEHIYGVSAVHYQSFLPVWKKGKNQQEQETEEK